MAPLITVGISFFNAGAFFREAVQSVFAQSFQDWELILIDDGSTDGSLADAQRIFDPRVKVLSDGSNRGLPARLNEIAQLAKGEFLVRMDADDLMHPQRLERQMAVFSRLEGCSILASSIWILSQDGDVVGGRTVRENPSEEEVFKLGGIVHATLFARREWFLENPYDSNYPRAEDRELFVRVSETTRFINSPERLYFYRFCRKVPKRAYLQSYSTERKVLRKYGPQRLGVLKTASLLCRSWLKSFSLPVFLCVGGDGVLTKRGVSPVTEQEKNETSELLATIRMTPIPGWENE